MPPGPATSHREGLGQLPLVALPGRALSPKWAPWLPLFPFTGGSFLSTGGVSDTDSRGLPKCSPVSPGAPSWEQPCRQRPDPAQEARRPRGSRQAQGAVFQTLGQGPAYRVTRHRSLPCSDSRLAT